MEPPSNELDTGLETFRVDILFNEIGVKKYFYELQEDKSYEVLQSMFSQIENNLQKENERETKQTELHLNALKVKGKS